MVSRWWWARTATSSTAAPAPWRCCSFTAACCAGSRRPEPAALACACGASGADGARSAFFAPLFERLELQRVVAALRRHHAQLEQPGHEPAVVECELQRVRCLLQCGEKVGCAGE